jgi:hypothetical protein
MATAVLGRAVLFRFGDISPAGTAGSAFGTVAATGTPSGGPPSGNDGVTFSGRKKTLVLPIAIRGLRMLVSTY